ncbi:MAG: hypothetical protein BZY80_04545 [SAR202 cluster bacterium Io17-Chloro-G2]|nr:MAG: hypothetical protein BZY80_04545 [SAR202 cluster bacterium Io17-Chloro-G2]
MKRYLIFGLLAALTASLAACSQAEPATEPTTQPTTEVEAQGPATAVPPGLPGRTPPSTAAQLASQAVTRTPAGIAIENGITLRGRVRWEGLASLFSQRNHPLQREVERFSVLTLSGGLLGGQSDSESFEFQVPADEAYLLKARISDGVNLWAMTPRLTGETMQDVSLETTYEAALVYAVEVEGAATSGSAGALKDSTGLTLFVGADRLVNTVKRVVNNALFWRVDYSIFTEMNESNIRAFGGGLGPFRPLDSLTSDPQPDYVPHIFMLNTSGEGPLFLDRILMSELNADRWAAIVVAEDIPPRVYRGLGGLDVAHGGTSVVYGEDKCFQWNGDECQIFRQVLVTYPLDPPAGVTPTEITSVDEFDGAHRPQWSWDQRKIAFHAYPNGRLDRAQIYVAASDGSGSTQLTFQTRGQNGATAPNWSPGNSRIVYVSDQESFSWDIWVMNSDGSGQENLTNGRVKFPNGPKFSPDGRRIVFYAQDDSSDGTSRGGPDNELWIMNRDGAGLRKITDNDADDETPVWGLNGIDVVYSVDQESWAASNVFTGQKLFGFPGITRGRYVSPVLAATPHVLIPTQAAIEAARVSEEGYVDKDWLAGKVESNQETEGYQVITPSNKPPSGNVLSDYRYEIFTAFTQTPIYQSDVGGWVPPVISWP